MKRYKWEAGLQRVWNVFPPLVFPHYLHFFDLPPMPATNHVSFAVLLTCYDFFLLWSSNVDFLFLFLGSVSNNLSDLYFCISDLFFYLSPSFPSFSPASPFFLRVLFLSSCVIFSGTYGPWHCHTHKFLSLFVPLLCFFSCHILLLWLSLKQNSVWILMYVYCWSITSATLGCRCVTYSLAALLLSALTVHWLS